MAESLLGGYSGMRRRVQFALVLLVAAVLLGSNFVTYYVWSNGSSEIAIEQYSFEVDASYVIAEHSGTFYRRDGSTGEITSGSDDDTLIQYAINQSEADGGSVYVKAGSYSASVTLRDNVTLTLAKGVSGVTVSIDSGADCTLIDEEQGYRKEYVAGSLYSLMDWRTGEFWYAGENRTDLIAHPTSEATFIVETDGTYTWMTNCSTGQRDATSTDAVDVVNWACGNLTDGGDIFMKNGNYSLSTPLLLQGWDAKLGKQIRLQGESKSGTRLQPQSGVACAINLSRQIAAYLSDFTIDMPSSGGQYGIYGEDSNDTAYNDCSLVLGTIERVRINGNSGDWMIYLKNPEFFTIRDIFLYARANGVNGMWLETTSVADYNYGSGAIEGSTMISYKGDNTIGLKLTGATRSINLLRSTGHFWIEAYGGTNQTAIWCDQVISCHLRDIHFEHPDTGIYCVNTASSVFAGGDSYSSVDSGGTWFHCNDNTAQYITFRDWYVNIGSGTTNTIIDDGNTGSTIRNIFENFVIGDPSGGTMYFNISATTICRGWTSFYSGATSIGYWAQFGDSTQVAHDEWIRHYMFATPVVINIDVTTYVYGTPSILVNVYKKTANSTHFQVAVYWTNGTTITSDAIWITWYASVCEIW